MVVFGSDSKLQIKFIWSRCFMDTGLFILLYFIGVFVHYLIEQSVSHIWISDCIV